MSKLRQKAGYLEKEQGLWKRVYDVLQRSGNLSRGIQHCGFSVDLVY